ncbi:hypothetical protein BD324DRAFT_351264 [Kockovaella imperatae]|uniref:Zn(2)-C6 fungal-type domain-containing protein n=1 Tax=Kockovaella imperatae TaxID=4999 RepID=A0A1Y1UJX6_9TREE|nr:hypothetical protein BD324DRAFT_351264 [Kockovaella imperatae]ORX38361.1 hypothetical protein BD324DRAFT_351264 [Kockovaella imperatae]
MDSLALIEDGDVALSMQRSKFACLTCRVRKVRCDELRPECGSCVSGKRECIWQDDDSTRPLMAKSRGSKACESCRVKKLRCSGPQADGTCERCKTTRTECTWLERKRPRRRSGRSGSPPRRISYQPQSDAYTSGHQTGEMGARQAAGSGVMMSSETQDGTDYVSMAFDTLANTWPGVNGFDPSQGVTGDPSTLGALDIGEDEKLDLINLYFAAVHTLEYLCFIPSHQFMDMYNAGTVPQELLMLMLANALRFGSVPSPDDLARADAWADEASRYLLLKVHRLFSPIDLMALLLACHYDYARGNFASALLLSSIPLASSPKPTQSSLTNLCGVQPGRPSSSIHASQLNMAQIHPS